MPKAPPIPEDPTLTATDSTVRNNVHRLMAQHGVISGNQSELARIAKVDQTFISKLLKGKTSISVKYLHRIASALGVEPWMLLVPSDYPLSNPPVLAPLSDREKQLYRLFQQAATPSTP